MTPLALEGPSAEPMAKAGRISAVSLLGGPGQVDFTHDASGLHVKLPATAPCDYAYVLKISGLQMNPPTATPDGNPL